MFLTTFMVFKHAKFLINAKKKNSNRISDWSAEEDNLLMKLLKKVGNR